MLGRGGAAGSRTGAGAAAAAGDGTAGGALAGCAHAAPATNTDNHMTLNALGMLDLVMGLISAP